MCIRDRISWGLSQCDILKISDDEIEFMTGEKDIKTGVKTVSYTHLDVYKRQAILFTIDFCRRIMRTLDFNG